MVSTRNLAMLVFVGLLSCGVNNVTVSNLQTTKVLFTSDGQALRLAGATDSAHSYPNPTRLKWLQAELRADGRLKITCRTEKRGQKCPDSPLFVRIETRGAQQYVKAYDIYQRALAEVPFDGRCPKPGTGGIDETGGTGGSNGGIDETGGGHDSQDAGEFSESSGTDNGGDDSPTTGINELGLVSETVEDEGSPVSGSCPGKNPNGGNDPKEDLFGKECDVAKAKTRFCQVVNEKLAKNGFKFTYDCNHLDQDKNFPMPNLDGELSCKHEIVKPAVYAVRDEFGSICGREATFKWLERALEEIRVLADGACGASPLVLDLDSDGIHSVSHREGVQFDLLATGHAVKTGWLRGNDGFLVLDRNGNGQIDDGSELFGTATAGANYEDGFTALSSLDENGDQIFDAQDSAFRKVRIWVDQNGDGVGPAYEWLTMAEARVSSLNLTALEVSTKGLTKTGNFIPLISYFTRTDGSHGQLVDVFFGYRPSDDAPVAACFTSKTASARL